MSLVFKISWASLFYNLRIGMVNVDFRRAMCYVLFKSWFSLS